MLNNKFKLVYLIKRIENFSTIKGVTLEVLSIFDLQSNATLQKLLLALREMERFDILLEIAPKLDGMIF